MELLLLLLLPALIAFAYAASRHDHDRPRGRLASTAARATEAFREFNATNVELWERYLRAQRPWEADWLHWVRTSGGWRLEGTVLPPYRHRPQKA